MKIKANIVKIIELRPEHILLLKKLNDLALPVMQGNGFATEEMKNLYKKLSDEFKEELTFWYLTDSDEIGNFAWESDDFIVDSNEAPNEKT